MLKNKMIGKKIKVTDPYHIKVFEKEFILLWNISGKLWAFGEDINQPMANGYLGESQFKIL